jgi:hypothetical protein
MRLCFLSTLDQGLLLQKQTPDILFFRFRLMCLSPSSSVLLSPTPV